MVRTLTTPTDMPRPRNAEAPTRRVCLVVLSGSTRGNSLFMQCVSIAAHAEGSSAGKSKWSQELGGAAAERPFSCHVFVSLKSTPLTPSSWLWQAAEALYMFCFGDEEPLCKSKMRPSTDLAAVFDFCSPYWECPAPKKRSFACWDWVNISWVAGKNIPQGEAMHPVFPCWPQINSSALLIKQQNNNNKKKPKPSILPVQSLKKNSVHSRFLIIERLLSIIFINLDLEIWNAR